MVIVATLLQLVVFLLKEVILLLNKEMTRDAQDAAIMSTTEELKRRIDALKFIQQHS